MGWDGSQGWCWETHHRHECFRARLLEVASLGKDRSPIDPVSQRHLRHPGIAYGFQRREWKLTDLDNTPVAEVEKTWQSSNVDAVVKKQGVVSSGRVNRLAAIFTCFLACLMSGPVEARAVTASCEEAGSCCCCGDGALPSPCVCAADEGVEVPGIAILGHSRITPLAPPPGFDLAEATPFSEISARWHPSLPWHAPPAERRARLSVWNL